MRGQMFNKSPSILDTPLLNENTITYYARMNFGSVEVSHTYTSKNAFGSRNINTKTLTETIILFIIIDLSQEIHVFTKVLQRFNLKYVVKP